jgi:hypothetical protein
MPGGSLSTFNVVNAIATKCRQAEFKSAVGRNYRRGVYPDHPGPQKVLRSYLYLYLFYHTPLPNLVYILRSAQHFLCYPVYSA